jgi:hypothetical protein
MIRPAGSRSPPGLSAARGLAAVFCRSSYYLLVITILNIVPLISELPDAEKLTYKCDLKNATFETMMINVFILVFSSFAFLLISLVKLNLSVRAAA